MRSLYLQDANGPAAEAILSFSDAVILTTLPILSGVLLFMLSLVTPSPAFRLSTEHQRLEFVWTLLPMLVLIVLAVPSLSLLYLLDEVGSPLSTTKAQGHQWYWNYEAEAAEPCRFDAYIHGGPLRLLTADNNVVFTSATVLRLLITSADVLHSWTIPAWGLKADAVPGRLNQLSTFLERPGTYYGQCSEICGSNHSFIPIAAEVLH